jgi:hypothetical protein
MVTMNRDTLINSVVKMVVKGGSSLRFFSSEGSLQARGEMAKQLRSFSE